MRKLTLKGAKKKAWDIFSKFIRQRDPKCVTCGSPSTQAGHFWHNVLDFDEENVNGQCTRCNHYLSGNLAVYSTYLLNKLGEKGFKNLEIRHYQAMKGEKRSIEDYDKIYNHYSRKLG